ncbi:MAG: ATP-binding protein, partial [Chlorobiales bacterium]|nr:ATP-binding protein [Chlorobiales bacterium]
LSLINNILDLSKVESGRMELEYAPFDLSKTLETTIASLSQQAKNKGLLLDFRIEKGLHTFLKGDANRLQQVLLNLTGNAIKFTCTGGITISVSSSDIPCVPADKTPAEKRARLLFRIEDTGIGIEAAHKSIIFEAFGQADVTTSRKYGGTGLGLTISRQIIRMMDGDIWFVSDPGRGTVFHFSVCMDKGAAGDIRTGSAPGAGVPDRKQPARILLAEDNPDNVKVARAMIARLGHRVAVTHNGTEVMEQLRQAPFDLILMDVEMPVMDGLETTRLIRAGKAGEKNRSIRIIALTAHALTGYREKCLEAGMDDYISKPFDPMDLARIIGRAGPGTPSQPGTAPPPAAGPQKETPVLDSAKAIRRLWGDTALYDSICRDFMARCPAQLEELEAHLEGGTLENAVMLAHTLKGNCGNIGAPQCQQIVAELESAARSKNADRAKARLRRLVRAAAALKTALYAHLSAGHDDDNAPSQTHSEARPGVCDVTLAQCLDDLEKSLEKGRDDDGLLDCITTHWPEGIDNALVQELSRHIENFDFIPALETLDRMGQALQPAQKT